MVMMTVGWLYYLGTTDLLIIDKSIVIIHVRKGGGTSFCRSLIDILPQERVDFFGYTRAGEARAAESRKSGGPWKHSTAAEAIAYLGRKPKKVYLVSVRPYRERVGSFFHYSKRRFQVAPKEYGHMKDISIGDFIRKQFVAEDNLSKYCLD